MLSYSQASEDIILARALGHVRHDVDRGFYIDIGAFDPVVDSVTKHFYVHGWRGINVEPSPELHARMQADRPEDVNVQAAVSDAPGEVVFHFIGDGQLGTVEQRFVDMHRSDGHVARSFTVPAMTLSQICEQHAADREIHFLKVDVEGHEAAALRGMDFKRFRPWILVVEATVPNRVHESTHHEWEDIILGAGYRYAMTDLPNRYYYAEEHAELAPALTHPVDRYRRATDVREIQALRLENERLRRQSQQAA